jgi:hypothetical protein
MEGLMDNILGIADVCDSLNHVHEVGGIREILHWIVHSSPQLIPNEVKDISPSSFSAILLKRLGAKYLKPVASPCLGSMVARKN